MGVFSVSGYDIWLIFVEESWHVVIMILCTIMHSLMHLYWAYARFLFELHGHAICCILMSFSTDRIFTTWHEHALLCMIMQSILCVASGFASLCTVMQSAACSCILNIALDWNYHTLHDHAVLEHARAVNCACCVWFMRHKHGRAVLCMIMSYLHLLLWVLARLCNNPQPLPPWSWITTLHAYAHGSLLNFYLYKYLLYYIIYYSLRTMNHSSVGMCSHE